MWTPSTVKRRPGGPKAFGGGGGRLAQTTRRESITLNGRVQWRLNGRIGFLKLIYHTTTKYNALATYSAILFCVLSRARSTFEPSLPCMARKLPPAEANNTTQQQCTRSTVSPCPLPCPLHSTTSLMPPSVI